MNTFYYEYLTSKNYKKAEDDPGADQKPPDQEEDGTDKLELHSLEALLSHACNNKTQGSADAAMKAL